MMIKMLCETCENHRVSKHGRACMENVPLNLYIRGCFTNWKPKQTAAPSDLEQTVIEELLAIEGYVNGIRSGDESPKRMCDHISSSIGVIRSVIKEIESLRTLGTQAQNHKRGDR